MKNLIFIFITLIGIQSFAEEFMSLKAIERATGQQEYPLSKLKVGDEVYVKDSSYTRTVNSVMSVDSVRLSYTNGNIDSANYSISQLCSPSWLKKGLAGKTVYLKDSSYVRIIIARCSDGTFKLSYTNGSIDSDHYSISDLAISDTCYKGVCTGTYVLVSDSSYQRTIVGFNIDGKVRVKYSNGSVDSDTYDFETVQIVEKVKNESNVTDLDLDINFSEIEALQDSLGDLAKISYAHKARIFTYAQTLLNKYPYAEANKYAAASNLTLRTFIILTLSPLIENNTSKLYKDKIIPSFLKLKKELAEQAGITSLSDLPRTKLYQQVAINMLVAGLQSAKAFVSNSGNKTVVEKSITALGKKATESNPGQGLGSVFADLNPIMNELSMNIKTQDLALMIRGLMEYLN